MLNLESSLFLSFLCWIVYATSTSAKTALPVVLWHGMGDTCCNPLSIGGVKDAIQDRYGMHLDSTGHVDRPPLLFRLHPLVDKYLQGCLAVLINVLFRRPGHQH